MPPDRREAIQAIRNEILRKLPDGYEERIGFGMIAYVVPLEIYPDTYHKQPLMYAALANQENHMAVYLSAIYGSDSLTAPNLRKRKQPPGNVMTAARAASDFGNSTNYH